MALAFLRASGTASKRIETRTFSFSSFVIGHLVHELFPPLLPPPWEGAHYHHCCQPARSR